MGCGRGRRCIRPLPHAPSWESRKQKATPAFTMAAAYAAWRRRGGGQRGQRRMTICKARTLGFTASKPPFQSWRDVARAARGDAWR